jgi:CDP-diacylglycerol--serine O-phosphatidyltransferase
MLVSRKFIPSLFTILNAFAGFLSIVHTTNENFETACWFIVYAGIFDVLDGIIARLTKSTSDFGVELDSLADVISFGVAPSFLLYTIHFKNFDAPGIVIASLILIFAAIRLARFNISLVGFDKEKFTGIPTPMTALTIVSYLLYYHERIFSHQASNNIILLLSIGLPLLMVSKFKYPAFPKISIKILKQKPILSGLIIFSSIIILITKGIAAFPFFIGYSCWGIITYFYNLIAPKKPKTKRKFR